MKRKTQAAAAAFAVSAILLLALTGFLAVDLSAAHDMRGQYEPLLRLSAFTADGMEVSLLGRHYYFLPALLTPAKETLWKLRGLFPDSVQAAGYLFVQLHSLFF